MSFLVKLYKQTAEWFWKINYFPLQFVLDVVTVINELILYNVLSTNITRLLIILVVIYFPFIFDYAYGYRTQMAFTKPEYLITVIALWFFVFYLSPTFIFNICYTMPRLYYFIVGMSMTKTCIRYFKLVRTYSRSTILSLFVASIVYSSRYLLLFGLTFQFQPTNDLNPIPVLIFSLFILTIYILFAKQNHDVLWIFFLSLLSGTFMAYRFYYGNKYMLSQLIIWKNELISAVGY